MSLYPSYSNYGQPAYPQQYSNGYYQYQQPPPAPVYHYDPEAFRREYARRLSALNVNSRPIIQDLSMFAQEYSRFAEIAVRCIDAHIRSVPPWMKLPGFYLLDAISKNVYEPYARHFSGYVYNLFLETYGAVDSSTRSKMEEMLITWRTGSPQGKELFGIGPQVQLERSIWSQGSSSGHSGHSMVQQISKSQVLNEIELSLGQKQRALLSNPYDSVTSNQLNILHQLRKLVEAGVSQEELQQIQSQLRTTLQSSPAPPAAPAPNQQWQHQSQSYHSGPQHTATYPMAAPTLPVVPQPPPKAAPPQQPVADINNLLSTLIKAGVVSANSTPVGAGASVKEEALKPSGAELEKMARDSAREYRQAVLSRPVKLSSTDIMRKRPSVVDLLYRRLPTQCKQCGIRFSDSPIGKKDMEEHLDFHFAQNRKAVQSNGRGHSRSWFVGVEDWINDQSNDVKSKGPSDKPRINNSKAAIAAEAAKRDSELRAQYVVVPPGDEAKHISCPICKETLQTEFLEDDEEWAWKNAVKRDDRIFHATCHAEASASKAGLVSKLRSGGGSRASTPEVNFSGSARATPPPSSLRETLSRSPPSTPKLAGTKRKAEDSEPFDKDGSSTPTKKQALSPLAA